MMIPKSTPNELVDDMINRELEELCKNNAEIAQRKWEARLNYQTYEPIPRIKPENPMRAVPNEWCSFLKCRSTPCPSCPKKIYTPEHLRYEHNLIVRSDKLVWKDLKEMSLSAKRTDKEGRIRKEARETLIPKLRYQIKPYLDNYRENILSLRTKVG